MRIKKLALVISIGLVIIGIGSCVVGATTHSGGDLEALFPLMLGFGCFLVAGVIFTMGETFLVVSEKRELPTDDMYLSSQEVSIKNILTRIFVILLSSNMFKMINAGIRDVYALIPETLMTLMSMSIYATLLYLLFNGRTWSRFVLLFLIGYNFLSQLSIIAYSLNQAITLILLLIYLIGYSYCFYILIFDKNIKTI